MGDVVDDTCAFDFLPLAHTRKHTADRARGKKWNPLFRLQERLPVKLPQSISGLIHRSDSLPCSFFRELSLPSPPSVCAGRRWLGRCLTRAACQMRTIQSHSAFWKWNVRLGIQSALICGSIVDTGVVEVLFRQMCDWYVQTYQSEIKRSRRGWRERGGVRFKRKSLRFGENIFKS